MNVKAVIFDFGRTLFDSDNKALFHDTHEILLYCQNKGYRMAVVSLVGLSANTTVERRRKQIESSGIWNYLEIVEVTDRDKDKSFDYVVSKLGVSRDEILIVDDRTVRGIRYGNNNGHPTVWFQNGKFANELPDSSTGAPTLIIKSLSELQSFI